MISSIPCPVQRKRTGFFMDMTMLNREPPLASVSSFVEILIIYRYVPEWYLQKIFS